MTKIPPYIYTANLGKKKTVRAHSPIEWLIKLRSSLNLIKKQSATCLVSCSSHFTKGHQLPLTLILINNQWYSYSNLSIWTILSCQYRFKSSWSEICWFLHTFLKTRTRYFDTMCGAYLEYITDDFSCFYVLDDHRFTTYVTNILRFRSLIGHRSC
jgi:hypothetical protein